MNLSGVMKKKSAHWIQRTHIFHKDEYECSACKSRTGKPYKVCPHCGLRMKGSKYDPSWVNEMEMIDAIIDD